MALLVAAVAVAALSALGLATGWWRVLPVFLHRPAIRAAMALVVVGCALAAGR